MRKVKFVIFGLILIILAFWAGRQSKATFEYILLKDRNLLDELCIDEIYINHIKCLNDNDIPFNGYRTYKFLTDENQTACFLPTQNQGKIKIVIDCVKNAKAVDTREKLNDILFFRDGRKIYYTYIGWDDEKIYGETWQSGEFIEIINQWKQDLLDGYNKAIEKANHEHEERMSNTDSRKLISEPVEQTE